MEERLSEQMRAVDCPLLSPGEQSLAGAPARSGLHSLITNNPNNSVLTRIRAKKKYEQPHEYQPKGSRSELFRDESAQK